MANGSGRLHIRRHNALYRVPSTLRDPAWRGKMDSLLGSRLAGSLGVILADDGADGVWLIRSLDIRCRIGAEWEAGEISEAIARQIAGEIGRVLGDGADGVDVLWFPSRVAFLSRFLADCAAGRALGRWEYEQFSSWATLSPSAVLRELALSEPSVALGALANMLPGELKELLRQVLATDADEVLRCLAASSVGVAAYDVLVSAVEELLQSSELPRDPRRAALFAFLHGVQRDPRVAGREFERLARDFGEFAEVFGRLDGSAVSLVMSAVESGDWSSLPRFLGGGEMARTAGVLSWPREHARKVVGLLSQQKIPDFRAVSGESLSTRFGGMFLLLPLLDEFPWAEATAGWPDCGAVPALRMAQYLTTIGALGQARNSGVASDSVLRLALGIDGVLDRDLVAGWARSISPALLRRFWRIWLDRLVSYRKVSLEDVGLCDFARGVLAVDSERGIWVGAGSRAGVLRLVREVAEREPVWSVGEFGEEAEYASLSLAFELPSAFRRLTMLTAQSLVRELAWRLPGFSRSSLPHVFENFLDFSASVEVEEERFVVHMHKPPLHLVLSMTGMARREFRLEATGGKRWVLTQAL